MIFRLDPTLGPRKRLFRQVMQTALLFFAVFALSALISLGVSKSGSREQKPTSQTAQTQPGETTEATEPVEKADLVNPKRPKDKTKIVYLTFDDGPGQYTEELLDLLAKYEVKATFFVTGVYSKYTDLIAREAQEGHSVGVHSYTHNYNKIYASTDAFWSDFTTMQKVIAAQTGSETKLMRFPGGGSNTVSKFNPGIMTTLTKQAEEKGLYYFDWNVASGDAGGTTESAVVLKNCKTGITQHEQSVILCHDVKKFTVDAMEPFIRWALQQGYTFMPLTEKSPTVHHNVLN